MLHLPPDVIIIHSDLALLLDDEVLEGRIFEFFFLSSACKNCLINECMFVSCISLQPTLGAFFKLAFFFLSHVLASLFDSLKLHFPTW